VGTGFRSPSVAEEWPEEHAIDTRRVTLGGGEDGMEWHETPKSSNVFAFAYDSAGGILYVKFKAPAKPVAFKPGKSPTTGRPYRIGIRPHVEGPAYAYGSAARPVPPFVYDRMRAASSVGGAVWEYLRVHGSHYQHKYPYVLAAVPDPPGGGKPYVPRKAVRESASYPQGFRVRTVPQIGVGRRGWHESTLDEYGTPNPGRYG
jgi:hypothetical protein